MRVLTPDQQQNSQLAEKINQEARGNPQSSYAGKFVGIANGQVVSIADNFEDGIRLLRQAEPDNTRTYFLEVGADYRKIEYIWETSAPAGLGGIAGFRFLNRFTYSNFGDKSQFALES